MARLITLDACCELTVDKGGVVRCEQAGAAFLWFEDRLLAAGRDHVPPAGARAPEPVTLPAKAIISRVLAHGGARVILQDGAPVTTDNFTVDGSGQSVVICERRAARQRLDVCTTGQSEVHVLAAPTLSLSAQAHGNSKVFVGVPPPRP